MASAYYVPVVEIASSEQRYIDAISDVLAFNQNH